MFYCERCAILIDSKGFDINVLNIEVENKITLIRGIFSLKQQILYSMNCNIRIDIRLILTYLQNSLIQPEILGYPILA